MLPLIFVFTNTPSLLRRSSVYFLLKKSHLSTISKSKQPHENDINLTKTRSTSPQLKQPRQNQSSPTNMTPTSQNLDNLTKIKTILPNSSSPTKMTPTSPKSSQPLGMHKTGKVLKTEGHNKL